MQARIIADKIFRYIMECGLLPGDRIPPETEIARKLGITRHQVRRGMVLLKEHEKWIQIRGSGTYLPGDMQYLHEKTIAILTPFPGLALSKEYIGEFQDNANKKGFSTAITFTSQSPEFERRYLKTLVPRRITGLVIEPSPYKPWNFDVMRLLVKSGTKVALLNCPSRERSHFAVFLLDYRKAGYMACIHLLTTGFSKQCLITYAKTAPHDWEQNEFKTGVETAAREFGVALTVRSADCHFNDTLYRLEWRDRSEPVTLCERTGYICGSVSSGVLVNQALLARKIKNTSVIVPSQRRKSIPFSYVLLDETRRWQKIMAYFANPRIPAERNIEEYVSPIIIPCQDIKRTKDMFAVSEKTQKGNKS